MYKEEFPKINKFSKKQRNIINKFKKENQVVYIHGSRNIINRYYEIGNLDKKTAFCVYYHYTNSLHVYNMNIDNDFYINIFLKLHKKSIEYISLSKCTIKDLNVNELTNITEVYIAECKINNILHSGNHKLKHITISNCISLDNKCTNIDTNLFKYADTISLTNNVSVHHKTQYLINYITFHFMLPFEINKEENTINTVYWRNIIYQKMYIMVANKIAKFFPKCIMKYIISFI